MKKVLLATLSLFMMIPSIQTAELTAQPAPSKTQQMLDWFKSLKEPTQKNIQVVKDFLNSKWQCLRHGTNCSKAERASLAALSVAATAAVVVGVVKLKRKRVEQQKLEEEQRKREEAEEQKKKEEEKRESLRKRAQQLEESIIAQKDIPAAIREARRVKKSFTEEMERSGRYDDMGVFYKTGIFLFKQGTDISALMDHFANPRGRLGSFGVIALSPHISDEEKIKSFAYLRDTLEFKPSPEDRLQLQPFDWERQLRKMKELPEEKRQVEYYSQLLPLQLMPTIVKYAVPPILTIPEEIKRAMNERSELREIVTKLYLFIAQHPSLPEAVQWFDNNVIVHDPLNLTNENKEVLLMLMAALYTNAYDQFPTQDPNFYGKLVRLYPNSVRLELKSPNRNYTIKDIVWASPTTTNSQKATIKNLNLHKNLSPNANLRDLYTWEIGL